ncbi:MAG: DUF72 domain-containing protein [Candidatus Paceibacterota bacterium]
MILIGTSGFSYSDWEGSFYPEDLDSGNQLEYYTKHFDTVELNNTFYHLPSKKTFVEWRERTPDDFIFTVKVSRFITHRKYLKDCSEAWLNFYERAKALKEKLGPFLVQLPPRWTQNLERVQKFVQVLKETSPKERFAFEFRNESWFDEKVIDFFKQEENITLCMADSQKWPSVEETTGNFVFMRFHGPGKVYRSKYSEQELKQWAAEIEQYLEQNLDVYCYFNNDYSEYAIDNAKALAELL